MIDIIVMEIHKLYGLLLGRDWPSKLNGYFSTDWSHTWLPHNGKKSKIRVDWERYMEHTITKLHHSNAPLIFHNPILGYYYFDTYFKKFSTDSSTTTNSNQ